MRHSPSKPAALAWAFLCLPAGALAAGGGSAEPIVFVADSRKYTGWLAWVANLYNESLAYFTLLTVIVVPLLALVLGSLFSFVLARTGIDLRSRAVGGH